MCLGSRSYAPKRGGIYVNIKKLDDFFKIARTAIS
jgi:hypothetical protein